MCFFNGWYRISRESFGGEVVEVLSENRFDFPSGSKQKRKRRPRATRRNFQRRRKLLSIFFSNRTKTVYASCFCFFDSCLVRCRNSFLNFVTRSFLSKEMCNEKALVSAVPTDKCWSKRQVLSSRLAWLLQLHFVYICFDLDKYVPNAPQIVSFKETLIENRNALSRRNKNKKTDSL